MLTYLKMKRVFLPLIVVVFLIVVFGIFGNKNPKYQTVEVVKADFSQEVSVTGKVVAANNVLLGFETGGKVTKINVKVGDSVKAGQTLAYVGSGDAYASYLGAEARLEQERARLGALQSGNRPEDIQISQIALDNAMSSLTQSKEALISSIRDSYAKSDNSIRVYIDPLYRDPRNVNPQVIGYGSYELNSLLNSKRADVGIMLQEWNATIAGLNAVNYDVKYVNEAKNKLETVRAFLDLVATLPFRPSDGSSSAYSDATIASYQSNISVARSSVASAISSLNSSLQSYESAVSVVNTTQATLALKKAGSRPEDINVQQAAVKSAEASLLQTQSSLAKTTLVVPFDGTVTKVDLTLGQIVAPNTQGISMISNVNFEINSFIPEADIAKVKVGDKARVSLDAYGEDVMFTAIITKIDLSDTQVEGVSTYKTVLQFVGADERIRSGMTANVDIVNGVRTGVLSIPQSALITKDGNKTVLVIKSNNKTESRSIQTGQIDANGNIEVVSGVSEGETIVTNPVK